MLRTQTILGSERRQRHERKLRSYEIAASGMLCFLLLYYFDFVEVFVAPGSSLNRFVLASAGTTAAMILAAKPTLTQRVLRIAWPWVLIIAWFGATSLWAAYPDVSRTRTLSFAVSYLAALGLAIGLRSPRALIAVFLVAFGIIGVADPVSLAFATSYTDIGVRGLHMHKNAAGFAVGFALVAMIFALFQVRSAGFRVAAAGLALIGVIFLYLTNSKTSIGLVVIALGLLPLYAVWVRRERARLSDLAMTALACTLLFVAGASGSKMSKVGELLFGDPTLTNRMMIWVAVEKKIAQSPRRGFGFGSIWGLGEEWNPLPGDGYVFYSNAEFINEAHNGYLDLRLHGGYVALALGWFITLRVLWFSLILATSRAVPISHRWTFCMLHCLVSVLLVRNFVESTMFFPGGHGSYFFLIVCAQIERWKAEFDAHRETHRHLERVSSSPPSGFDRGAVTRGLR